MSNNLSKMSGICAIIDAQGFMWKGEFVIRELAMAHIGDNYVRSWDVETPVIEEKMVFRDKITNEYIRSHHSGLDFNPPVTEIPIAYKKIKAFLAFLHKFSKTEENHFFGLKNEQLSSILSELRIPFIQLQVPTYPMLMRFYNTSVFCTRHTFKTDGVCAVQNVDHINNYLKDKDEFDVIINTIK